MKTTLDLPEVLHTRYAEAAAAASLSLPKLLVDRLTAAVDLPARPLVLSPAERIALEEIANEQLATGADIVKLVKRCTSLDLGEAQIDLSVDDLILLEQHASFYGETLQEMLERTTRDYVDFILSRA